MEDCLWKLSSWGTTGQVRARVPEMSQKFPTSRTPRNSKKRQKGIRGKKEGGKERQLTPIYDPIERVIIFLCLGQDVASNVTVVAFAPADR